MRPPRRSSLLAARPRRACGERACGGLGGLPPARLPTVKRGDGREYRVLDKGAWKGYYDDQGRIAIVEYDSNGDGRADYIAHYDERRQIRLIEVDEDHDALGGPLGVLRRGGRPREGRALAAGSGARGRVDLPRPGRARPSRIEYDDDGDGKSRSGPRC